MLLLLHFLGAGAWPAFFLGVLAASARLGCSSFLPGAAVLVGTSGIENDGTDDKRQQKKPNP